MEDPLAWIGWILFAPLALFNLFIFYQLNRLDYRPPKLVRDPVTQNIRPVTTNDKSPVQPQTSPAYQTAPGGLRVVVPLLQHVQPPPSLAPPSQYHLTDDDTDVDSY